MSYKVTPDDLYPLKLNETNTRKSVLQNVAIILNTWKGSVPLYREFGISPGFMHKPKPVAKAMMRADIKEAVERFERRAEVVSVTFSESDSGLIPTVEVNILE